MPDGSRVNVIVPPLAIDGPALTIRKFKKDKLTLDQLVKFGTITPQGAEILRIIGRCRVNTLVSGGTGSGKTTLLNCLTQFIDDDERIITCEDAAELQLQQPHVVRLETRPPNLEGEGQITMRDLVRNCLRMRPERIIVGEVRGPEAFDLLQAMNTGHDGSMGTLHANNPREALSRLESMITMGGFSLPSRTIREMICASVDVVVQAARLRDGSRRITHITEVMGMEGDVIITQDLFVYDMIGEDAQGNIIGRHRSTGIGRPRFWDRARYYGEEQRLAAALDAAEAADECACELTGGRHARQSRSRSSWRRSRSAASPMSSSIRSCPASGKAEQRMASVATAAAGGARRARPAAIAPRRDRGDAQGSRGAPQEEASAAAVDPHRAGRPDLVEAAVHSDFGRRRPRRCSWSAFIVGAGLVAAIAIGFAGAFGLPRWLLSYLEEAPRTKFLDDFPDAVDIIVRGVKAGLPLLDCMKMIANEAPEPVKSEFRVIVETQAIGMPLGEACAKLYERMPVPEANFFAIVVAHPAEGRRQPVRGARQPVARAARPQEDEGQDPGDVAGGQGLRRHHRRAADRGDDPRLPDQPDYITLLFTEPLGHLMLAGSAVWMFMGVLVMQKMINFDF